MQAGLTPALAFGLTSYSLVLAAALTFVLHRPTRRLACLRLTALVSGFALARILSTSASIIESPPARNKGGIKKKDTRVLKLTAQAIRSAGGGRIVSCKSAKDRTSMSVTAEQVALLRRRHELPKSEAQPLLDAMRRDGVRMQNTFKNVGKAGYAFNALQRLLLPASLRAPKDTTVSGLEA